MRSAASVARTRVVFAAGRPVRTRVSGSRFGCAIVAFRGAHASARRPRNGHRDPLPAQRHACPSRRRFAANHAAAVPARHRRLTGTKEGCAEGDCGACTVVVVDLHGDRLAWRPVNACIRLLPSVNAKAVFTVEALRCRSGALHPVQQALVDCHGSQCGFCTPGFVMSLFGLYKNTPTPDRAACQNALSGNLCRCTGYRPILEAAQRMYELDAPDDWRAPAVAGGAPNASEMELGKALRELVADDALDNRACGQRWLAPRDATQLAASRTPNARLVAGATDLALRVTKQHENVGDLIFVGEADDLARVEHVDGNLRIGAAVSLEEAFAAMAQSWPETREAWERFASIPIRNSGTLAGNVANGSPIGDAMPVLIALGAAVELSSATGNRTLPLEDYYLGYQKTARTPGEFVRSIVVPPRSAALRLRAYKLGKRYDQDISAVFACFALCVDEGVIASARIGCGGVAAVPSRARATEAALEGRRFDAATFRHATETLAGEFAPISDMRASAHYRATVLGNLLHRFWLEFNPGQKAPTRVDDASLAGHERNRRFAARQRGRSACPRFRGAARQRRSGVHRRRRGTGRHVARCIRHQHGRARKDFGDRPRRGSGVPRRDRRDHRGRHSGRKRRGPIVHDDPILAQGSVQFVGQPLFAVAAESVDIARRAASLAHVRIEPASAVLTIDDALERKSFVLPPVHLTRGETARALEASPRRLRGRMSNGGQDHFYLEGQIALAMPQERGGMRILVSTQNPSEVQHMVARALGIASHDVVVECRRMGGGFGGKETQMSQIACLAALLARRNGRAVKFRLDRDDDMRSTGKRHAFEHAYDVGFDSSGRVLALDLTLASRCGFSADLSGPVNDRAVFHADNAYWLPAVSFHSYRCRTNTVSDTAFRGFGGPQGMFATEAVLDDVARTLGVDPLDVRKINLYGDAERNVTPYGMVVEDNIAPQLIDRLEEQARYRERRREITAFNAADRRGIALTPVKFGIAFTATHYNQAAALLHLYQDGTVLLNHGGTEMGQGLYVKVQQVVAQELGIPVDCIRVSAADTSKVPNASPTAASSGSDLNGMAALEAARVLRERLVVFAAQRFGCSAGEVVFTHDGRVSVGRERIGFRELARLAYLARVPLSATGFHATPKIHYDRLTLKGRPFLYFAYGAAVSEVAIDTLTGEHRLLAVDIRRRRALAQSGHRSRPDRRRLPAGLGVADHGRAVLRRARRLAHARTVDIQESDRA